MKRLTSYISIGNYSFRGVVQIDIEKTWELLTDICKITIPRKLSFEGQEIASGSVPLFKKGDKIKVSIGYDGINEIEFEGYIRAIELKTPIVIHCEDSAFLLKKSPKTVSYKKVTLEQLLQDILPSSIDYEATTQQELGQLRIQRVTAAEILQELKEKYNIRSYFIGTKLFVGLAYPPGREFKQHHFEFERNIISDDLEYRSREQNSIRIKAISILPDNSRLEVEVGNEDGELRTFNYYNISSESELQKIAERELEKQSIDGFRGSFTVFGEPSVQHGDGVKLVDNKLDRQGIYLVKKVAISFGVNGYRRVIYLDKTNT